jgi:biotin operon repressor
MTGNSLSKNQYTAKEVMPATGPEIAESMGISLSYVYDLVEGLRRKGVDVQQDTEARYYVASENLDMAPSFVADTRQSASEKREITKSAAATLAEMEFALKKKLEHSEPAINTDKRVRRDGGTHMVVHRTDDHFGEHITNQHGDDVFNSDIAEQRVRDVFEQTIARKEAREDAGETFDGVGLLMGGDHVTNDAIYEGQKNETDATVREQIDRCADVYLDMIRTLSEQFPHVTVACQVGNHGRLASSSVNADGIVFSMLDKIVRESTMDNVTFIQSDKSYYIDFQLRDYDVHLRHGHDSSLEHIGTSAGKQRWLSWMVDHGFDVAFRGHYHMLKQEPINGVPVHMGGSIVPQTEFEESHALSGRPVAAVHGMTDRAPTEWTERIYFG